MTGRLSRLFGERRRVRVLYDEHGSRFVAVALDPCGRFAAAPPRVAVLVGSPAADRFSPDALRGQVEAEFRAVGLVSFWREVVQ